MDLASELGEREACAQVGLARASFRRRHELAPSPPPLDETAPPDACLQPSRQQRRYEARKVDRERRRQERARRPSSLALGALERQAVLDAIHEPRFVDRSVPYIHATLWDEGTKEHVRGVPEGLARRDRRPARGVVARRIRAADRVADQAGSRASRSSRRFSDTPTSGSRRPPTRT
jgi:hypothetical protein